MVKVIFLLGCGIALSFQFTMTWNNYLIFWAICLYFLGPQNFHPYFFQFNLLLNLSHFYFLNTRAGQFPMQIVPWQRTPKYKMLSI